MSKLYGFYKGKVLNLPLGWIWQGKSFYLFRGEYLVINKILGFWAITGKVEYLDNGTTIIKYPQLGLEDTLVHVGHGFWLGELKLWKFSIYFTLYEGTLKKVQEKPQIIPRRKISQSPIEGD